MSMSDNRIGYWGAKPVYPPLSISGKPYARPATTRDLGGNRFVVIDTFPSVDVEAEIAAINAAANADTAEVEAVSADDE